MNKIIIFYGQGKSTITNLFKNAIVFFPQNKWKKKDTIIINKQLKDGETVVIHIQSIKTLKDMPPSLSKKSLIYNISILE